MDREKLIAVGIDEGKADEVLKLLAETDAKRQEAERAAELEREQLRESVKSYEEQLGELRKNSGNAEELKAQIARLEEENRARAGEYQKSLDAQRVQAAVRLALMGREHKPHDAEIVCGLIDLSKVEVDERGNIRRGLDKQLEDLEAKRPFLFDQGARTPAGARPYAPNPAAKNDPPKQDEKKSIGKELARRAVAARLRAKGNSHKEG
jgi:hypothetical protein